SDTQLLAVFRSARSEEAFAQVVARHGSMVYRVCLRLLGNQQDAEDASQATFMQLARRPPSMFHSTLAGWLYTVARNTALPMARARNSRGRRQQMLLAMRRAEIPGDAGSLRQELDAALALIPERLQEAVILRYLEGRSLQDAAILAGCPQGTMGRRALEGLQRLRAILSRRGMPLGSVALAGFFSGEAAANELPVVLAWTETSAMLVGTPGAIGGCRAWESVGNKVISWMGLAGMLVAVLFSGLAGRLPEAPFESATLRGHGEAVAF